MCLGTVFRVFFTGSLGFLVVCRVGRETCPWGVFVLVVFFWFLSVVFLFLNMHFQCAFLLSTGGVSILYVKCQNLRKKPKICSNIVEGKTLSLITLLFYLSLL